MPAPPYPVAPGEPHPLGATVTPDGVNLSLYSRHATSVELLVFERLEDQVPAQVVAFEPYLNHTYNHWHVLLEGAGEGLIYAYRVQGPWAPERGLRFNANKILLDPYARGIVYDEASWSHEDACHPGSNVASAMKSLVVDPHQFDWEGVQPPRIDPTERVIYEVHVRGFTQHPSAGVRNPGTFDALVEKIPYLLELGVTTVELLPVFQFDEAENPFRDPHTGEPLRNYWGYSPIGFFAPHRGYYTHDWSEMRYLTGFRDMVKALHRAGIEVILDVVFNHTAEGNEHGPTMCFRGLDNPIYYILDPARPQHYANYSGTGNTLSCNHPVVRRLVLDCLRYWVEVMHVDGFRFDLASILSRDELGRPMANPPLPWEMEMDPVLSRTLLVAEAWDAAGLYQVGSFPGERWFEWNGVFRDDIRRFVRGELGFAGAAASRLMGSRDIYGAPGRLAYQSVNFVTCHDGFTLADLVSYAEKHNEANGEGGRDGNDANFSDNHGVEGPTDDPAIRALRARQMKNFIALLFLAQGTPMLQGGDELGRTQRGNNNAYCQDNEISWYDWRFLDHHADHFAFTKGMIRFRRHHPSLRRARFIEGLDETPSTARERGRTYVRWHGVELDRPDWRPSSRTLAFTLLEADDDEALHVLINMHTQPLSFAIPPVPAGRRWVLAVDTAARTPLDVPRPGGEHEVTGLRLPVPGRCVRVLVERSGSERVAERTLPG